MLGQSISINEPMTINKTDDEDDGEEKLLESPLNIKDYDQNVQIKKSPSNPNAFSRLIHSELACTNKTPTNAHQQTLAAAFYQCLLFLYLMYLSLSVL